MRGFIVYLKSDKSVVARYAGGSQTPAEILKNNGYNDTHDCALVFVDTPSELHDYNIDLTDAPAIDQALSDDRKVQADIDENKAIMTLFKICLDQENRIRALEGADPITAQAFRSQAITVYKSL